MHASEDLLKIRGLPLKFLPVNGASLGFVEKGDGEAVVFVHGAICDLRIWLDQVELFSHKYRAISYSRRDHWPAGRSDVPVRYSRSTHAEDLICFLEELDLQKAHLVGHSYGGAVALLAAIQRPDMVMSLTLGEPSPIPSMFDGPETNLISRQKVGFAEARILAQMGKAEDSIRKFLSVIIGADVLDQLTPAARHIMVQNAPTLVPMLERFYESPPIGREQLKNVAARTLLMRGELSPRIALVSNSKLNDCLPNAREVILRSTSHGLHIENPVAFSKVVLDFIENNVTAVPSHGQS